MLQNVLFIDDDKPTNVINERLAQRSNIFKQIKVYMNSVEALDYLENISDVNGSYPDLIFLDINMPAFNGWEFLDAFEKLKIKDKIKVVMLSTSLDIGKKTKKRYKDTVSAFESKPLSVDKIMVHATKN